MQRSKKVVLKDGGSGTIERELPAKAGAERQVQVRLENGRAVVVPTTFLQAREDGSYYLPVSLARLESETKPGEPETTHTTVMVVPVIAEELEVEKREFTSGGVRVTKRVQEWEETIEDVGFTEHVEVERVAVNRPVENLIPIRYEGNTMIVPLFEEVLEKRLILKEEIRITKERQETGEPRRVVLRREEATVERFGAGEETRKG